MVTQNVMYFTDKEVEFVHLLVNIGIQRTVATVLVFLANTTGATSRDIERGTDLRQPEVRLGNEVPDGSGMGQKPWRSPKGTRVACRAESTSWQSQ